MFKHLHRASRTNIAHLILAAVLSMGTLAETQAATNYLQAPQNGGDALFANASSGAVIADNFSVASNFDLISLTWWGSYDSSDTDEFIINLYADGGGSPGALIQNYAGINVVTDSTALTDIANAPVFRYDFSLPSALSLIAGSYYLSVSNETTNSGWYWLTAANGDNRHWELDVNGNSWSGVSGSDLALEFQYTTITSASVPEPSIGWLIVFGFLPIILFRKCNNRGDLITGLSNIGIEKRYS